MISKERVAESQVEAKEAKQDEANATEKKRERRRAGNVKVSLDPRGCFSDRSS